MLTSKNKDDMAAQLAELAMKYETAKQEKKITMLQKDQEMVEVKIYPYTIYSLMIDIGGMFNSLFFIGLILIYHF